MYQSITSFAITTGSSQSQNRSPSAPNRQASAKIAEHRGHRDGVRDALGARARILRQQLARVAERARIAQRKRPERSVGVDQVRIPALVEARVVLEMDPALHEERRHVGEHAEHAHRVVDPAPVRHVAVNGLVPDREREVDGSGRDRDVHQQRQRRQPIPDEVADQQGVHREQQSQRRPVGSARSSRPGHGTPRLQVAPRWEMPAVGQGCDKIRVLIPGSQFRGASP